MNYIVGSEGTRTIFGRNDPCPCGSGRKTKKCHLAVGGPPDGVPVIVGGLARPIGHNLKRWNGEVAEVVAYLDAGAGDAIHAMRHVDAIEKRAARVYWIVRPSMLELFKRSFPDSKHVTATYPIPQTVDFFTSTFSLIELGMSGASRPKASAYLLEEDQRPTIVSWKNRARLRGGLCARGDSTQAFDKWRSIHDERLLLPLTGIPGIEWRRFEKYRGDWAATAALMEPLDFMVSVDTGVAHLAGALGLPLILLDRAPGDGDPGPDERWDEDYLQDGPLYRDVVRFRQRTRDGWAEVIARAVGEIARRRAAPARR